MTIQLNCSDIVRDKLMKLLNSHGIFISDDAKIVLTERGYTQPLDKICLVFDGIDYMEVFDLIKGSLTDDTVLADTITGFSNNRYSLIRCIDISYIEASGSKVTCYTINGNYQLKKNLYHYEQQLGSQGIVRINKSQLVNIMLVTEIVPWFNGRLVLKLSNNTELEVSRMYAKNLRKTLDL